MPAFSRFNRYVLAVARHGSVRRAAEQLGIAASAVDRQILLGEQALGAPLFERLPTGLRPTAAGEIFLAASRRWQTEFDAFRSQLEGLRGLRRGRVAIAAAGAGLELVAADAVGRLLAEAPRAQGTVLCLGRAAALDALLAGRVDIALVPGPDPGRDILVHAELEPDLGFVAPPGHEVLALRPARPSAAAEHPLVAPLPPLAGAACFEAISRAIDAGPPVAASDDAGVIARLVASGRGISVLSALEAADAVHRGALGFARLGGSATRGPKLLVCVLRGRPLGTAATATLAWLEERLVPAPKDRGPTSRD